MSFASLRRATGSLRARLTLWNTAVVLLLIVICLLGVREGLRVTLLEMLNQFLVEEWDAAAEDVENLHNEPEQMYEHLNRRAWGHPRRQLFVQLVDGSGKPVWSSMQTPELPPLTALRTTTVPLDLGDYRILQKPLKRADGNSRFLRVGVAEAAVQAELRHITETLGVVGGLLLLLIPLGAYYLAGRAIKPLADIIATTDGLHPARLDERLPLRGSHDELEHLSRTINGFLDRIARYLQENREFTANVAHELRSPLAAMQFSLELALNADRSGEEYKEFLFGLLEECGNLRTLVNQLLLLAEGDAGLLGARREELRLDELLLKSIDMFQVVAEADGVDIKTTRLDPVLLHGDGQRLWQVFNNLIDNALKFTPPGGTITIELFRDESGSAALVRVADTGSGIAADDLPHIFERFYQGDKSRQRRKDKRGTGLGLSICRSIVEAHGGTIEAASTPGQGTTLTVRLPDGAGPGRV